MSVPTKEDLERLKTIDLKKIETMPFVYADEMLRLLSEFIPKYIELAAAYDKLYNMKTMESKSPEKLIEFQRLLEKEKEYVGITDAAWKLFKEHYERKNNVLTDLKVPKIPTYIIEEFMEEEKPAMPTYVLEEIAKPEPCAPWYKRIFNGFSKRRI